AISWADDFANGNRSEKGFELHEGPPFLGQGVNGAKNWLRQLAPQARLCGSPHAAQDRDNAPPFRRCVKISDRPRCHRNFVQVWFWPVPKKKARRTADFPAANNRKTNPLLFLFPNRHGVQIFAGCRFYPRW